MQGICSSRKVFGQRCLSRDASEIFYMVDARCVETSHCKEKWQLRICFGALPHRAARVFHKTHAQDGGFLGHSKLFTAREASIAAVYRRSCHGGGMRVDGLIQTFHLKDIHILSRVHRLKFKNWVMRDNAKAQRESMPTVPRNTTRSAVELETLIGISRQGSSRMCSVPQTTDSFVINAAVHTPLANKAMLGDNAWRDTTIGYCAKGHLARSTYVHDSNGNSIRGLCYVTTFVQAMFHQETHTHFCDLCRLVAWAGGAVLNIPTAGVYRLYACTQQRLHTRSGMCARGCAGRRQARW